MARSSFGKIILDKCRVKNRSEQLSGVSKHQSKKNAGTFLSEEKVRELRCQSK